MFMGVYHEDVRGGGDDGTARDARIFVANFEDAIAHLRRGEPIPARSIDGADETGMVFCVVDVTGALKQVGIADGWWEALGPGRVADAVLSALRFAKAKAAMARLVLARYGHPVEQAPVDLGTIFTEERSEPLPAHDADNFPEALARKVDRSLTILERAERFSKSHERSERMVVSGPRGMFRVLLSGSDISGAEVNEYGLHRSDAADLADDARSALLAAATATRPHSAPGVLR
jgi:hypothetical protein